MQGNTGTAAEWFAVILDDGETTPSAGFPAVLLVIVVLGYNNDLLGYQVSGVETYTELPDHTDVSTCAKCFHESFCTRLGNGTEVLLQFLLGHADTAIADGQDLLLVVNLDANLEVSGVTGAEDRLVGERQEANLVERLCCFVDGGRGREEEESSSVTTTKLKKKIVLTVTPW